MKYAIIAAVLISLVLICGIEGCYIQPPQTCQANGGTVCSEFEVCNGYWISADDTSYCCIGSCSASWSCRDSDGGINYDVKGSIPLLDSIEEDRCGADNLLLEMFCREDVSPLPEGYLCDEGSSLCYIRYDCPNGCQDGACLSAPTNITSINCENLIFIYHPEQNPNEPTVQDRIDLCIKNKLFYAGLIEENDGKLHWYGNCVGTKSSGTGYLYLDLRLCPCTDSDGGMDYYVKGTTVGLAADGTLTNRVDSCWPSNYYGDGYDYVAEWFCWTNPTDGKTYAINTNEKCPNGCQDGACIAGDYSQYLIETDIGNCKYNGSWISQEGNLTSYLARYLCDGNYIIASVNEYPNREEVQKVIDNFNYIIESLPEYAQLKTYNNQKIYVFPESDMWASNVYILGVGRISEEVPEELGPITNAYLAKYPSDI